MIRILKNIFHFYYHIFFVFIPVDFSISQYLLYSVFCYILFILNYYDAEENCGYPKPKICV